VGYALVNAVTLLHDAFHGLADGEVLNFGPCKPKQNAAREGGAPGVVGRIASMTIARQPGDISSQFVRAPAVGARPVFV